jgi:hypothetical protein
LGFAPAADASRILAPTAKPQRPQTQSVRFISTRSTKTFLTDMIIDR